MWFYLRNYVDLCQLASSDVTKKERKLLICSGLLKKKVLENQHLGSISLFLLFWEKFCLPFPSSYLSKLTNSTVLCFFDHSPKTLCWEQPLTSDWVVGCCQARGHSLIFPHPHLLSSCYDDFGLCRFLAVTMCLFTQIPHCTAALGATRGAELAETSCFLDFPLLVLPSPCS